jgi:hypothetical protein
MTTSKKPRVAKRGPGRPAAAVPRAHSVLVRLTAPELAALERDATVAAVSTTELARRRVVAS